MHSDNLAGTPRQAAVLDQVMSALFADLQSKGPLAQMLVVLATEFGRTPRINNDGCACWRLRLGRRTDGWVGW